MPSPPRALRGRGARGVHHTAHHPKALAAPVTRTASGAGGRPDVLADPVDDLRGGRARREDLRDAEALELGDVLVRDDPAAEDDDVVDTPLGQQLGRAG